MLDCSQITMPAPIRNYQIDSHMITIIANNYAMWNNRALKSETKAWSIKGKGRQLKL